MQSHLRTLTALSTFVLSMLFLPSTQLIAQEAESSSSNYAYIALDPDIITNYAGDNSKKLGYLRLTIEIMLDDPNFIDDIEHHMPLLRAIAIEAIGSKNEQQVRSLTGREELRRDILKRFRDILTKEAGSEVVKDIIFTKYLRQGG